jgi:phosphate transport system protein
MEAAIGHRVTPGGRPLLDNALARAEEHVMTRLEGVRGLLEQAVRATVERDADAAARVVNRVDELSGFYDRVREELITLMARQAPVATDLRLSIALLHANDRIARMESQCVSIATLRNAIPEHGSPSRSQLDCLVAMAKLVDTQVADAAQGFRERDVERVQRVLEQDREVNRRNRACFDLAVREGSDEDRRRAGFFGALMARALERIGDNAIEIAHQAKFVVTGQLHVPA